MSEQTTSSGLTPGVDVAIPCQTPLDEDVTHASPSLENWHSTFHELCKNPPVQHPYLANPLAATPQAYGLWSGQLPPPLITPYGPMPFFGGFFPGAYPLAAAGTGVQASPMAAVKPEDLSETNKTQRNADHAQRKAKKTAANRTPSSASRPSNNSLSKPSLTNSIMSPTSEILNDEYDEIGYPRPAGDEGWVKNENSSGGVHEQPKDEKELKRERRKQSNRESARRSRLRKQKECETLQKKVQELVSINRQLEQQLIDFKQRVGELERENQELKATWS